MGLFDKLFGTYSQRELKHIYPIRDKVLALDETYAAMSDADLRAMTPKLKDRLAAGETLDDILPDAFAGADHRRHRAPPGAHRRDEDR